MNTPARQKAAPASPLTHGLGPHFPELARFHSTKALEASPLYASLRGEVERVLDAVERGDFRPDGAAPPPTAAGSIRATAWNIERGSRLDEIIGVLSRHKVMN